MSFGRKHYGAVRNSILSFREIETEQIKNYLRSLIVQHLLHFIMQHFIQNLAHFVRTVINHHMTGVSYFKMYL
jgi:hypothetical protein